MVTQLRVERRAFPSAGGGARDSGIVTLRQVRGGWCGHRVVIITVSSVVFAQFEQLCSNLVVCCAY